MPTLAFTSAGKPLLTYPSGEVVECASLRQVEDWLDYFASKNGCH